MPQFMPPARSPAKSRATAWAMFVAVAAASASVSAQSISTVADTVLEGDRIGLRFDGLEPGTHALVTAERYSSRQDALYASAALYRVSAAGDIDPSRDAPIAAPWTSPGEQHLFQTVTASPADPALEDEDPLRSMGWRTVRINLDADLDGIADDTTHIVLARSTIETDRTLLGEDHPGAFLLTPLDHAPSPRPAIIVLGGSEGNDSAARDLAPRWASRGYAVVGLPYYSPAWGDQPQQIPGLPRAFADIPIDRLGSVRDFLAARDDIDASRIGILGVSKGAEMALAGASRIEGFAAIAAIVPSDVIWEGWGGGDARSSFSYKGEPLPFVPYLGMGAEFAKRARGQAVRIRLPHDAGRLANPDRVESARIRVEDIAAPVFVSGGDEDNVWDSGGMARNIKERRDAEGLETVAIVSSEAGHSISGTPYSPADPVDAALIRRAHPALVDFFERHLKNADKVTAE